MPKITPQSTMAQVMDAFPSAKQVLFARYHIGGCSSCGFAPTDTLEQVLRDKTSDVQEAIRELELGLEAEQKILAKPDEVEAMLKEGVKVIDIRPEPEFRMASIDGSLPATQALVDEIFEKWPKDARFVLVCHKGDQSAAAAANLSEQGFTGVRALRGGIDAWSELIDPLLPRY